MSKRIVKVFYSEARIALMREVSKNHPNLVFTMRASGVKPNDWPGQLAEIAAYCKVLMDGNYMPDELEALYPQLLAKLRKKGQIIIHTEPKIIH